MKIWLTKYQNPNSVNYLSNEYVMNVSSGNTNFGNTLKLFNIPSSYSTLAWKYVSTPHWVVIGGLNVYIDYYTVEFGIYTDLTFDTKLAYYSHQINNDNYGTTYYWWKFPLYEYGASGVTGYLLLNLVNVVSENSTITNYGTITCKSVIDYFEETHLLTDYISTLDEQLINNFDITYSVSDIDIKMSNLTGTLSNTSKSLFNFLNTVTYDQYIRVAVVSDANVPLRVGILDLKSIEYNFNRGNDNNTVKFKVYLLEKDLHDANSGSIVMESSVIGADWLNNTGGFNDFMLKVAEAFGVDLEDTIDFDQQYLRETGSSIILNTEFLYQNRNVNLFEWFTQILKCGGILFKVYYETLTINSLAKPKLKLFYPNEGNTEVLVNVMEEIQGNKGFNYDTIYVVANGTSQFQLFLQTADDCTSRTFMYEIEDNYYSFNDGTKLDSGGMLDIGLKLYNYVILNGATTQYIAGMTFEDSTGSLWIVSFALFQNRYKFLLYNYKKTISLKIPYSSVFELDLYNKFSYKDTDWYVEKIYDINLTDYTLKLNAVEL